MPVTKITLRTTPAEYYAGLEHIADAVRRARETEDYVEISWCPGDMTHYRLVVIPLADAFTYVIANMTQRTTSYVPATPPPHLFQTMNVVTDAILADIVNHSQGRQTRYYEAVRHDVPAPEWAESEAASG